MMKSSRLYLFYGAILRSYTFMRTILLAKGWRVLEFEEEFLNVAWNWYVYMFLLVITLYIERRIHFPFPIDCDFVKFLECLYVICMLILKHTWYQNHQNYGKIDGYGFVVPNYWGEFNRLISVLLQVLFKSVMCNYYRLCNTIN